MPRRTKTLTVLLLAVVFSTAVWGLEKKDYRIVIVMDTIDDWSTEMRDGFKDSLNNQLSAVGARAHYQVFDTRLDPSTVPAILNAIVETKPDLICTINYPTVFADTYITRKLQDSQYKFVSSNPIPVQSDIIKDWNKPGGNVTGVGVFLRYNSHLRFMKAINPAARKLAFFSWSEVSQLNDWFEHEIKRACAEEGVQFVEMRRVHSIEEEYAFLEEYDKKGDDYFVMSGVTAFVHQDGSPATLADEADFFRKKIKHLQFLAYDEADVRTHIAAGICVVWADIGAQLAEKGMQILSGKRPGDLPWSYPRKYNIMLNLLAAKEKSFPIPQNILSAAYRVYTEYNGTYYGQGK